MEISKPGSDRRSRSIHKQKRCFGDFRAAAALILDDCERYRDFINGFLCAEIEYLNFDDLRFEQNGTSRSLCSILFDESEVCPLCY